MILNEGYYHVALMPTTIAGPAIAGKIYVTFHSYDYAFYLGGFTCIIGAFILIVLTNLVKLLKVIHFF